MTQRALEGAYLEGHDRILALLDDGGTGVASAKVPACPAWTVGDVASHLTGLCADVLAGNIAGAATDEWTAAQVEARRYKDLGAVLSEWKDAAPAFAAMVDDFPGWYGSQVVADLTVHEHDLRGALGIPGNRSSPRIAHALDFGLSAIVHPAADALGIGPLEVAANGRSWVVGGRVAATGDPEAAISASLLAGARPEQPRTRPPARVASSPFELFRAMTGRRSAEQIRRYGWSTDPGPYLRVFAQGPFTMRADALDE